MFGTGRSILALLQLLESAYLNEVAVTCSKPDGTAAAAFFTKHAERTILLVA